MTTSTGVCFKPARHRWKNYSTFSLAKGIMKLSRDITYVPFIELSLPTWICANPFSRSLLLLFFFLSPNFRLALTRFWNISLTAILRCSFSYSFSLSAWAVSQTDLFAYSLTFKWRKVICASSTRVLKGLCFGNNQFMFVSPLIYRMSSACKVLIGSSNMKYQRFYNHTG
jgi:hypothetical protein